MYRRYYAFSIQTKPPEVEYLIKELPNTTGILRMPMAGFGYDDIEAFCNPIKEN